MGKNNWERNRIISKTAQQILETVGENFLNMNRVQQTKLTWELRHQLADKAGCNFSTTARHLSRNSIIRFLQKRT